MSTEIDRLDAQLNASFEGEAWHGPSVMETLQDVGAADASARPIAGAHTIWELVLHLSSTYRLVLRRLQGDATPLTPAEDWPAVPAPTEDHWRAAVHTLAELNRALRSAVVHFDPARLDLPIVATPPYTAYTQFIGMTQHDLYHAGQMALLKKALHH